MSRERHILKVSTQDRVSVNGVGRVRSYSRVGKKLGNKDRGPIIRASEFDSGYGIDQDHAVVAAVLKAFDRRYTTMSAREQQRLDQELREVGVEIAWRLIVQL